MPDEFLKKKELDKKLPQKKISNSFIENVIASSNETALKMVWYIASELTKYEIKKDFDTYILNEKDIEKKIGIKIPVIRKNLKAMMKTTITFIDEEERYEEYISLIPRIKINYDGTLEIDMYTKITKLIINVAAKNNTFIDIPQLLKLENKHSIRLLPLLKAISQFDRTAKKQKTVDLNYCNNLFGTKYTALKYINTKILAKVKEELDNNSTLTFEYKMNKRPVGKGRPGIQDITIIPKSNNNYQSTIFSNFEDTPQAKTPNNDAQKKQNTLAEAPTQDKYIKFKIDKIYIDKIENELNYKAVEIMDEQKMFLDFCKKENKNYLDMSKSLYIHLKKKRELGL